MKIYGLDFTSAPTRKKPLVAVACSLDDSVFRVEGVETLGGFAGFEEFLQGPGE